MTPTTVKYSLIAAVLAAVAFGMWIGLKPNPIPVNESVPLPPAKEIDRIETIKEVVKVVYVYPKSVKPKLNLPKSVIDDESEKVTASSKLKAENRDYTITSVIDVDSGKSTIYARPDPLPIVALTYDGEASLAYGYKKDGAVIRLSVNQNMLQIKSVHVGASATLDSDGSYFAGLSANYKW